MGKRAILFSVVAALALAAPAAADLIASDSFDYAIGGLNANSGGYNWTSGWTAQTQIGVVSAALSYSSGAITINGGSTAAQITSLTGTAVDNVVNRSFASQTGDVYFSLLFRAQAGLDSTDFVQFNINDDTDYANAGSVGLRNSSTIENGFFARIRTNSADTNAKTNIQATGGATPPTYLLVGKFSKTASTNYNTMSIWVNPSTLTEPAADAKVSSVDSLSSSVSYFTMRVSDLDVGDQFQFDELQIGTTWASVVPEPGTLALLGAGLLLAVRRARRRA